MLPSVSDAIDDGILKDELKFLLHVRKNEISYERNNDAITMQIKTLMSSPSEYCFNEKVLIEYIESGYMQ